MTLQAISPRFAINIFPNIGSPFELPAGTPDELHRGLSGVGHDLGFRPER